MYPYVRCYCGRSIGDLYDIYTSIKLARYQEVYEKSDYVYDPKTMALNTRIQVEMGDVLDALGLKMECCRARMITQIEFKDFW